MGNAKSLHELAKDGENDEIIKKLHDPFVSINAVDSNGDIPLHFSSKHGRVETCKMLIQRGANVNFQDSTRCISPLHASAASGHTTTVLALLEAGAHIDAVDKENCTPLHHACHYDKIETALSLLNSGSNAYVKNIYGKTCFDMIRDENTRAELDNVASGLIKSTINSSLQSSNDSGVTKALDDTSVNNESKVAESHEPIPQKNDIPNKRAEGEEETPSVGNTAQNRRSGDGLTYLEIAFVAIVAIIVAVILHDRQKLGSLIGWK